MQCYLEKLKDPKISIAAVLQGHTTSSTSNSTGVFKQNMGTTPYTTTTKGKEREDARITRSVSRSASRKKSSADMDNEEDDDDELNLTEGSSQPGTPVKFIPHSDPRSAAAKSKRLPKFKKSKDAIGSERVGNESPASSLASSNSGKPLTRSSSRFGSKPIVAHGTTSRPRPAYTQISVGEEDTTPKPKRTSTRWKNNTLSVGSEDTPRARRARVVDSELDQYDKSGAKGKLKSKDVALLSQEFPLAAEVSSRKRGHTNRIPSDAKKETIRPKPFPLNGSEQEKITGKRKPKTSHAPNPKAPDTRETCGGPQPFPLSKKSVDIIDEESIRSSKRRSSSSENDDSKDKDAKKVRMGPRPHPMLKDRMGNKGRVKPPSTSSVSSSSKPTTDDPLVQDREARQRRIDAALALVDAEGDISMLADESRDPSALCPYCDQEFPPNPSPLLQDLLARARASSRPDPRPNNRLGLKASIFVYVDVCQRHVFENEQLPLARSKGWPTSINFDRLPDRIAGFRNELLRVVHKERRSVFWDELKAEIEQGGSRKVMGIAGQFVAFDKSQPGYYGEQGSLVISQTLYGLFPLDQFDIKTIAPISPVEFIQRVLVPEAAVNLIKEDMEITRNAAIEILRESSPYGVSMFPSMDIGGVEERMVKERALTRRKEIEAEEIMKGRAKRRDQEEGANAAHSKAKRGRSISSRATDEDYVTSIDVDNDSVGVNKSRTTRGASSRGAQRQRTIGDSDTESKGQSSSPDRPVDCRPRSLRRNISQGSSLLSFTEDERSTERSRKVTRRLRPENSTDAADSYVSETTSESDTLDTTTTTPRPHRLKPSKGGERSSITKSSLSLENVPPLTLARQRRINNSTSRKTNTVQTETSSGANADWVMNFAARDSSDDDSVVEVSKKEYKSKSSRSGSKLREEKSKDDNAWLLSSSQES